MIIFVFTEQSLLPPESRCWHQTIMFCTRRFLAPDSQILHQTCHVLHQSHGWNDTVVVGRRHVTVSNRQSCFTPDSRLLHHTVAFCTRKSHLAPDSRICTINTRLLHPKHLDGIWIGQDQYRMPLAPLGEYPEPWF